MEEKVFWFDGKATGTQRGITIRVRQNELSIGIVIGEVEELSCALEAEQVADLCSVLSGWMLLHGGQDFPCAFLRER